MAQDFSVQDREAERHAFLAGAGLAQARVIPLAGDASTRSYARLIRDGAPPLILMDAPPSVESAPCGPDASAAERAEAGYNALARLAACRVDAFVAVGLHLRGLGLSAPEVAAFDVAAGLAVMEDLGEGVFARLVEQGGDPLFLYEAAVDVLAALHRTSPPTSLSLPGGAWPLLAYDALALKTGADLFVEWLPRYAAGVEIGDDARAQWEALWAPIRQRGEAGADVFAHRDYHAENLLWLPERSGLARVGLLDFQDALRAHRAWDLLSLLQDARREVSPDLEAAMLDRYLAAAGSEVRRDAFLSDYAGLAALNNARITGLFARLVVRDGKPRYRAYMPRLWRLLARNLAHPDMAGLRAWFDRHVPQAARG